MSIIYVLFPPFHNSVMLGDSSVASSKFFDFGLAVEKATGTLRAGTFCGTDRYISPELERGEEKDLQYQAHFADVHSTAMTVVAYIIGTEKFDKLVSQTPIDASTGEKFKASELVATLKAHGVSASGIDLLSKMTDPNPNTRVSAVGAMGHRWLKEAKCVNPYLQEGAEEHRWVFYQADRLENLRTKNAELQEKVTVLEETSASADQKLDRANKQASEANKHTAELQLTNVELEKTISALKSQLEQKTADHDQVAAAKRTELAPLVTDSSTLQNEINILLKCAIQAKTPLSFAAKFLAKFDETSSDKFADLFFGEFKIDRDAPTYGCLLAFVASFDDSWKRHQTKSKETGQWHSLSTFLRDDYAAVRSGLTNALKDGTKFGKKYSEETKDEKEKDGKTAGRKQEWLYKAVLVAKSIDAKLIQSNINNAKDLTSSVATIKQVVDAVFTESAGFSLIPESYRVSFCNLMAIIHINDGKGYE